MYNIYIYIHIYIFIKEFNILRNPFNMPPGTTRVRWYYVKMSKDLVIIEVSTLSDSYNLGPVKIR